MIGPLPFRIWSKLVDMGRLDMLDHHRAIRSASRRLAEEVMRDVFLTGYGISRISMGEDCTPIVRRVDPYGAFER